MEVERESNVSLDEFRAKYLRGGRPVVLTDCVQPSTAFDKWDVDYLSAKCGANEVVVRRFPNGQKQNQDGHERVSLDRVLKPQGGTELYLARTPLAEALPQIAHELPLPRYAPTSAVELNTIWIGLNSLARLHYHVGVEAISSVIRGRKTFWLWPPTSAKYMKPFSSFSSKLNFSQLHVDNLDLDFNSIPGGARIELCAGESLFIPVGWWHAVEGTSEISILNAVFWAARLRDWPFPYPGLASLPWSFHRRPFMGVMRSLYWR